MDLECMDGLWISMESILLWLWMYDFPYMIWIIMVSHQASESTVVIVVTRLLLDYVPLRQYASMSTALWSVVE